MPSGVQSVDMHSALPITIRPAYADDAEAIRETKVADRIVVEKSARTMKLMRGDEVLKTYKVALGRQPVGVKQRTGDHKTPEGSYLIDFKNSQSHFGKNCRKF